MPFNNSRAQCQWKALHVETRDVRIEKFAVRSLQGKVYIEKPTLRSPHRDIRAPVDLNVWMNQTACASIVQISADLTDFSKRERELPGRLSHRRFQFALLAGAAK